MNPRVTPEGSVLMLDVPSLEGDVGDQEKRKDENESNRQAPGASSLLDHGCDEPIELAKQGERTHGPKENARPCTQQIRLHANVVQNQERESDVDEPVNHFPAFERELVDDPVMRRKRHDKKNREGERAKEHGVVDRIEAVEVVTQVPLKHEAPYKQYVDEREDKSAYTKITTQSPPACGARKPFEDGTCKERGADKCGTCHRRSNKQVIRQIGRRYERALRQNFNHPKCRDKSQKWQ